MINVHRRLSDQVLDGVNNVTSLIIDDHVTARVNAMWGVIAVPVLHQGYDMIVDQIHIRRRRRVK